MAKILIVDDERAPRVGFAALLRENGHVVTAVSNGQDALLTFRKIRPDLVLLDIMMPKMDGYEVCSAIRREDRDTPVIFLSALDSEEDQVRGLEVGADDFVSKTAAHVLLLARIRTAIARAQRFLRVPAPREMTKLEADIYRLLERNRGTYLSYQEIFSEVCGDGYMADEGAIRVHISNLRKKLPRGLSVMAKRGLGYVLAQEG